MEKARFDALARRFGHRLDRRRVVAAVGAGLGLATLGWLRPRPAAAKVFCGNCDYVCEQCAEIGSRVFCNLRGDYARG
jgi:hypothetical protein